MKVELDTWRDSWQGRGCKFKFDARSNEGQGGVDVDEVHGSKSTRKVVRSIYAYISLLLGWRWRNAYNGYNALWVSLTCDIPTKEFHFVLKVIGA